MKKLLSVLMVSLFLISCSSAYTRSNINSAREGDLSYRDLMLRDYDQMSKAVKQQIKSAQVELKDADAEDADSLDNGFIELRRALRLVFSRPNSDNMIAKLVPEVRRELAVYNGYSKVIHDLAKEGVQAFDKNMAVNTLTLATYTFMLENLMSEIQNEARENKDLRATIQMVADADLRMPADVIRERKLSGMFLSESPSEQAKRILKRITPSQK